MQATLRIGRATMLCKLMEKDLREDYGQCRLLRTLTRRQHRTLRDVLDAKDTVS
jgi:hypothetical protein